MKIGQRQSREIDCEHHYHERQFQDDGMLEEVIVETTCPRHSLVKRRTNPSTHQMANVSVFRELIFEDMMNMNQMGHVTFD